VSATIRAAVVGAGAIGARLDGPDAALPLTHAGGYAAAGFALAALVDPDPKARADAQHWGCTVYADFNAMMRAEGPQVLSLAVPIEERPTLLQQALAYPLLAVVAEKPLAPSCAEAERIVTCYRNAKVPLIVNYSRRFVPMWQQMRGGQAMSANIRYAKGIRHNGTHAIDLCRMLFGECLAATPLASKNDHWHDDPSVSAFLRFERCPEVFLQALDERCFTLFEVDIISATSRVIVDSDGRRARRFVVRDGIGIPSGRRLVEVGEEDTGAASAMRNLMQNVRDVLAGAEPLCVGEDGLAAQRIAEQLAA
jgi:predicted dehydrogenase